MKCFNCSGLLPDGAEFCPRCGAFLGFNAELIERAKANDQNAITELYNKTYSNVYYTIKSMIKDEETVLDILQDTYIKAFRSLDLLQDPTKFKAWIKRIAHNRAVDELRKNRTIPFSDLSVDGQEAMIEFEDTHPDHLPETVIDQQETARLMREILDTLPDDQRAVVSMHYYEQLSVRQIAAELNVSENTVKSRLLYGRRKIEAQVKELEKRGTKLYGLAPLPFLLLVFQSQEAYAAEIPASGLLQSILTGTVASAGTAAGAVIGSSAGKTTVKTAAVAAKRALQAKLIAGAAAVAVIGGGGIVAYHHFSKPKPQVAPESSLVEVQEEEQALPQYFLQDMERLAQKRMHSLTEDYEVMPLHYDGSNWDILMKYISVEKSRMSKDAVFTETGGVTSFYLVYEAEVKISEDPKGYIHPDIPEEYPHAVIVFSLDTFPVKFIDADGNISYQDDQFGLYMMFEDRSSFEAYIQDSLQFVSHDYYDIRLP